MRARRAPSLAVGLLLSLTLAACGGSSSGGMSMSTQPDAVVTATSGTPVVTIKGFAFSPSTLVIKKGMTVKFVQEDTIPHTVTGSGPSSFIKSPVLKKGDSYTTTFASTGTFDYICTIHPNMRGKVIVQ